VDTGLAVRLLGIKTAEEVFVHPNRGNLFESFAVAEPLKERYNQGLDPDIYFWRDSAGTEIDVVFEDGPEVKGIEIKSGKTYTQEFTNNLEMWMKYANRKSDTCAVIYAGSRGVKHNGIPILPWTSAGQSIL